MEIVTMKRQTIVNLSVAVVFASTSIIGLASEATECTQPCAAAAETITILPARPLTLVEPDASNDARVGSGATCGATQPELVKQAEAMNDHIKPVKELVGYVRSPQGLAIKLLNDHVVRIPAWVGWAMDPIGNLKNRAVGEARDQAKSLIKSQTSQSNSCGESVPAVIVPSEDTYSAI
jgi:hypothetical protein